MPNIQVNVDINKDQIQPDSGDRFQVIITTATPTTSYTSKDGEIVKGDNMTVTSPPRITTRGDEKARIQARTDELAADVQLFAAIDSAVNKALDGLVNGAEAVSK